MFDLMQRHRRIIMILVLLFAGVPMALFFGVGNPFEGRPAQNLEQAVIQVYDQPVTAGEFLNQYAALTDQMRAAGQRVPTATELVLNETVDRMIEGLIHDALLTYEVQNRPYRPSREFLEERLREFPVFHDANGNFSSRMYNQWVTAQQNAGMNWNNIWDMVAAQAKRDLYVTLLAASARVTEAELRDEFKHEHTRIKVKFMSLEPPVDVSEADIEAYYNEHQDRYYSEPKITAVVVPFSTRGGEPPIIREIIEQARAGVDYAELASEHSTASSRVEGGLIGWLADIETLPTFREVLFDLDVGAVSEPVEGPLGRYIYKVEDRRTDEATGITEVLAREIVIPARLEPEERAAIERQAEELIADAQEAGLAEAARAAGLAPIEIGPFDSMALDIEGLPAVDAARLRMALSQEGIGVVDVPIQASSNLYAAEITSISERKPLSLDEVRDEIVRDWTQEHTLSAEYAERLTSFLSEIQANLENYESLEQLREAYPGSTSEVQSTRLFSRSDLLFEYGWFIDSNSLHSSLETKAPGQIGGPFRDYQNKYYFVELVERQEPTEELWENRWPEERDEIRDRVLMNLGNERIQDHIQHQLEQAFAAGQVLSDSEAMFSLLGVDPGATPEFDESPLLMPGEPLPTGEPEMTPLIVPNQGAPDGDGVE